MRRLLTIMTILSFIFSLTAMVQSVLAQSAAWLPVTGEGNLRNFMSGIKAERTLPNGEVSRGEYNPDGTGTLYAWGTTIPRTWEVRGNDQICVTAERATNCYQFEKDRRPGPLPCS